MPETPEGEITPGEKDFSSEADPKLSALWARYRFPANGAPFAGSPAEDRLVSACSRYAQYILFPERFATKTREVDPATLKSGLVGDSEDYFAAKRRREGSSDSARRALHNEIAVMVVGQQRSGMATDLAEKIADFAVDVHNAFNEEAAS